MALGAVIGALALVRPPAAHAQGDLGSIAGLVIPGAYVLTSSDGRDALGSTKFYREANLFGRAVGLGLGRISYGVKIINATSHITPFSSGNQFTLAGPSVEVATAKIAGFRIYANAGAYASRIESNRRSLDTKWDFTPSAAAGLEFPLAPLVGLRAEYRMSERMSGVSTNGVSLSLQLF